MSNNLRDEFFEFDGALIKRSAVTFIDQPGKVYLGKNPERPEGKWADGFMFGIIGIGLCHNQISASSPEEAIAKYKKFVSEVFKYDSEGCYYERT